MPDQSSQEKNCPSSTCQPGAVLLGKVKKDGTIGFLSSNLTLDDAAAAEFQKLEEPERYYRFSSSCVTKGCKQWDSHTGHCTVIERVLAVEFEMTVTNTLPNCVIRKSCRWFFQEGEAACQICPLVITDITAAF